MKSLTYGMSLDVLRRASGLTVEELAKEANVGYKTAQRACAGTHLVTVPDFFRMLKVLKPEMVQRILKVFPPEHFEQGGLPR